MRAEISEIARSPSGRAIAGASVQVNIRGGSAATVYAAETGGTTLTNPLTTDSAGRIEGWLNEGSYDLVVSHPRYVSYTQAFEAISGLSPGGRSLGQAQIVAASTLTGTTPGDGSTPLYLNNVVLGSRPVVLIFDAPYIHADTDQQAATVFLQMKTSAAAWVAVTTSGGIAWVQATASGTGAYNAASKVGRLPAHRERYLAPTTHFTANTSYDFRIQLQAAAAGKVVAVYADDVSAGGFAGPASLEVVER